MYCESCGSKLEERAKFCSGCGTPAPEKQVAAGSYLTTQELLKHLRQEGEDLGDLQFKLTVSFSGDRVQGVFAMLDLDEDGETEYDKVTLYSYFAPESFNAKRAIAAVHARWFGVTNDGGNGGYQLVTSLRIETLTSVESFGKYVYWIGGQADRLEEELTGSDYF